MSSGFIPTREQSERIGRAVTHYERTAALLPPLEQRRIVGGSGGQSCTNVLRIFVWTDADAANITGSVTLPMTYDGNGGDVTWSYNATAATIASAFEAASTNLSASDVGYNGVFLTGAVDLTFPDISLLMLTGEITHSLVDSVDARPIRVTAVPCCV